MKDFCIGIDYGTDSVRALLVDGLSGMELAISVFEYPRWKQGLFCDPSNMQFRQHPLDYLEGIRYVVKDVIKKIPNSSDFVRAISVDTTGSTPVAVNHDGIPLALLPGFENNPNAMFVLWKDHSSNKEADQINSLCKEWSVDFSKYSGGSYSSEWFWAKILHILNEDEQVRRNAYSWVEHCDWIPALLTGNTCPKEILRSRCAAGHKAMWHPEWDGLPSEEFLEALSGNLKGLRPRLFDNTYTSNESAGTLSKEWSEIFGLSTSVKVGVGALDAHFGAVGSNIKPYSLSKVIGTSTCDMMVVPESSIKGKLIRGISGQVDGSILPGFIGLEAGQSAFGDIYAWFQNLLLWTLHNLQNEIPEIEDLLPKISSTLLSELAQKASNIKPDESLPYALDWMNGRRTPDANFKVKGMLAGLTLASSAPLIFRALVESTAFGAKRIADRFRDEGIQVKEVMATGGVAKKSPFVMQILADVMNVPINIVRSEQTCALGAAMFAAVVAGIYQTVEDAQVALGSGIEKTYYPNEQNHQIYLRQYERYLNVGSFIEKSNCIIDDF